ncbi:hypothetical protein BDY17DRAFT_183339 [Neohortaea acidophila]|uniref:Uncharacterized protein n=1 Tax=Neohortaea acidophila TaxID=245834 RepID=A0A6A6PMK0_9PEZI|nr:uncharacterized protein BDY17DRAFT_183339 [Neohortaea acidophila]KAF2481145.1 hypothetical protein BDY17DRAFT_183339 [Neohortaea acidophila]
MTRLSFCALKSTPPWPPYYYNVKISQSHAPRSLAHLMSNRPKRGQAAPAPRYLHPDENVQYCITCGRLIGSRKIRNANTSLTQVKYCSDKCKRNKPAVRRSDGNSSNDSNSGNFDALIESVLLGLLGGDDSVHLVRMSELEQAVLARRTNGDVHIVAENIPARTYNIDDDENDDSIQDDTEDGGVRLDQPAATHPQREGQERANVREVIRGAARRAVVFGLPSSSDNETRRKCEAVVDGKVVEPSFAKGDWGIRWREGS